MAIDISDRPLPADREDSSRLLLEVDNLHVEFRTRDAVVKAVNGLTYSLSSGETLAILGESGSGKSVSAQAVMGILDSPPGFVTNGTIRYRGENMLTMPEDQRRKIRGRRIAMIFQDALSSLNPVFTVGDQIGEMFRVHRGASRRAARAEAIELLRMVRIPGAERRVDDHPHQFSGGMRQRILIAIGIALRPAVLIADEPTTALDVTVQAQVLEMLDELRAELDMGVLLITHDLGVVAKVADRVAVMYAGRIVETAPVEKIFAAPAHPYTEALLDSVPRIRNTAVDIEPIPGTPPSLAALPSGCSFHPRCRHRIDRCSTDRPALRPLAPDRQAACHVSEELLDGR